MKSEPQLPPLFLERIQSQLPPEEYPNFIEALEDFPVVSLRINAAKPTSQFDEEEKVGWCDYGRYLKKRPLFAKDPLIFSGAYYVQEASSMFLHHIFSQVLDFSDPLKVLDLCASPGGKSTLINSLLNDKSLLISNEIMKNRVSALTENLMRWGQPNVLVTNNESADFSPAQSYFDVVVVDAPCSGEGMFRKDPKAIQMWSSALVKSCAIRQRQILDEIVGSLKPKGYLVYSTCTFAPDENEEILSWLSDKAGFTSIQIPIDPNWGVKEEKIDTAQGTYYGYRFYPHKAKGEGFFIACLQKDGDRYESQKKLKVSKKGKRLNFLPKKYHETLSYWVEDVEKFDFILKEEHLFAIPTQITQDLKFLIQHLKLEFNGVYLGKFRNGKLTPSHHLALSTIVSSSFPRIDLNYEEAIQFLRKQDLKLETEGLKDWVLVRYEGHILGWIKILQNRINNYYPTELRLRKEF